MTDVISAASWYALLVMIPLKNYIVRGISK